MTYRKRFRSYSDFKDYLDSNNILLDDLRSERQLYNDYGLSKRQVRKYLKPMFYLKEYDQNEMQMVTTRFYHLDDVESAIDEIRFDKNIG